MKSKLIITNCTNYDTRSLRRFFYECAKRCFDFKWEKYFVQFEYGRSPHKISGVATLGGNRMTIRLPSKNVDRMSLAFVISHELAHWRGMGHRQMKGNPRYECWAKGWEKFYEWAENYSIDEKPLPQKPSKQEKENRKLHHALAMMRKAETRAKRAGTILKKWQRIVKRLENQNSNGGYNEREK